MGTTWRKLIDRAVAEVNDRSAVEAITPANLDLDKPFNNGYGGSEGTPFTLWTRERVYFPAVYDGAEWVASVPRHPCDEATSHVGGQ